MVGIAIHGSSGSSGNQERTEGARSLHGSDRLLGVSPGDLFENQFKAVTSCTDSASGRGKNEYYELVATYLQARKRENKISIVQTLAVRIRMSTRGADSASKRSISVGDVLVGSVFKPQWRIDSAANNV
jgi:hypothetical protein